MDPAVLRRDAKRHGLPNGQRRRKAQRHGRGGHVVLVAVRVGGAPQRRPGAEEAAGVVLSLGLHPQLSSVTLEKRDPF